MPLLLLLMQVHIVCLCESGVYVCVWVSLCKDPLMNGLSPGNIPRGAVMEQSSKQTKIQHNFFKVKYKSPRRRCSASSKMLYKRVDLL